MIQKAFYQLLRWFYGLRSKIEYLKDYESPLGKRLSIDPKKDRKYWNLLKPYKKGFKKYVCQTTLIYAFTL